MKVYNVYHTYDEDGGFGDAVSCTELVVSFEDEEDAKAFVEKYSNPHIYDRPYANLWEGRLSYEEIEVVLHKDFDINCNYGFYRGLSL